MTRKTMFAALLTALMWLLAVPALAQEARNLTSECTFTASKGSSRSMNLLYNGNYEGYWQTARSKNNYLEVHLPEGETCSGVQIKWNKINPNWCVEILENGEWVRVGGYEADYLTTWTPLPNVTEFRIASHNRVSNYLRIHELIVLSSGERPDDIQVWEPTYEKADLLLVIAHPDDEYIFFGGLIPYYGAEMGKDVLVAYITESSATRRTELLDGLWAAGQRSYPLLGKFYDRYTNNLNEAYKKLGRAKTQSYMIELFRRYKPQVVVTHDFDGEYGHGVHKVCADIVRNALEKSADAKYDKASAKQWGTWEVPKCYIHLWEENQIVFDWHGTALEAFGGRSAFDVADEAWRCHLSQQGTEYMVYTEGPYDSQIFGLYHSNVGPDEAGVDFFEHLPQE